MALLSSNIKPNKTLYNNSIGQSLDRVYSMLLLKGGFTDEDCKHCADISTRDATQCCPNGKEYIVWYTNSIVASNGTGSSYSIRFAKGDVNYTGLNFQELVQCTPDLSGSDCNRCLSSALDGRHYPNMFQTLSQGVLKPSCYARFENSITT
ncbi:cysteine-rich receptor-like protein kinase 10 [Papaver somniferum]|uniref:cysteine-rich receptor-like protein kinase 10 n=1 Tax=Papaver somniferum TaxID=3469 RepID=UPI000E6F5955|nr:cysteine-rich receptor-like protein kinase 10 [Papaver somniferum]